MPPSVNRQSWSRNANYFPALELTAILRVGLIACWLLVGATAEFAAVHRHSWIGPKSAAVRARARIAALSVVVRQVSAHCSSGASGIGRKTMPGGLL